MRELNRDGHKSWTIDDYFKLNKRKLQAKDRKLKVDAYTMEKLIEAMKKGEEGWGEKVPNLDFDKIPEMKPDANKKFKFKNEEYENYVK